MCGIAGYVKSADYEISATDINWTLRALEERGRDATGIAWLRNNKEFYVLKAPSTASEFIELPEFKANMDEILKSCTVLFHTRLAVHGVPEDNTNNHPIFNTRGMIIHNGVVSLSEKFLSIGKTDTEQMMLCIQKYGLKKGLSKINGSASIAYFDFKSGGLYLFSRFTPLVYARKEGLTVFGSTANVLYQGFLIPEEQVKSLRKDRIFKIEEDGRLFKYAKVKRENNYSTHYFYTSDRCWD